jgi:hypothetical protein
MLLLPSPGVDGAPGVWRAGRGLRRDGKQGVGGAGGVFGEGLRKKPGEVWYLYPTDSLPLPVLETHASGSMFGMVLPQGRLNIARYWRETAKMRALTDEFRISARVIHTANCEAVAKMRLWGWDGKGKRSRGRPRTGRGPS